MGEVAIAVFEILEKAWQTVDCSLIDMKVEIWSECQDGRSFAC